MLLMQIAEHDVTNRFNGGPGAPRNRDAAIAARSAYTGRVAIVLTALVGATLLPWSAFLAATLPATYQAQHWAAVWTGLDVAEGLAAASTALLLARDDDRATLTSAVGATLIAVDAWFDVCTATSGSDRIIAIAEAACLELPLAIAGLVLANRLLHRRKAPANELADPLRDSGTGRISTTRPRSRHTQLPQPA